MTTINLRFFKLNNTAIMPSKAHYSQFEDAACDLFWPNEYDLIINPGERVLVGTGLSCIIPEGYWLKFHERSGLSNKYGIQVLGGVIDSGYTGELKVILYNSGNTTCTIKQGSGIAQFSLEKLTPILISELLEQEFNEEKQKRDRQDKGFGSSTK